MWGEFTRKPYFSLKERLICVISGSEKFRMVNAIFKQNMYSGVYEDLQPLDTPINLFETDIKKIQRYKLMQLKNVFETEVKQGGCLYIPSYYWFQSETQRDPTTKGSAESVFLTFEYESSSQLVEELMNALDKGILEDVSADAIMRAGRLIS